MALDELEDFVRSRIETHRYSYQAVSEELNRFFPAQRGFSSRNVRRFCVKAGITKISRLNDIELDDLIKRNIHKVGNQYGRKTMTGLLASQGYRVGENRVASSLKLMNPTPYVAYYYGEKIHIDQNEKLTMFGVTHVIGVDGFSKKIVGFCTMPIKNPVAVYKHFFRPLVLEHGLWSQVRVDRGSEWALLLQVQSQLSNHRYDTTKRPYVQTTSKQNHVVERMWVDVNSRVNYPVKRSLLNMVENGSLQLDHPMIRFCVSWYSIHICNVGLDLFIQAWNNHPLPSSISSGNRGTPNQRMLQSCCIHPLQSSFLPTSAQAVFQYRQSGGQITAESNFGSDPLAICPEKQLLRETAFKKQYPSFDEIYFQLISGSDHTFQDGLKYFIDLTYRLTQT